MAKKSSAKKATSKGRKGAHSCSKTTQTRPRRRTAYSCTGGSETLANHRRDEKLSPTEMDVEFQDESEAEVVLFQPTSIEWRQFFCKCFDFQLLPSHNVDSSTVDQSPHPAGPPKQIRRTWGDGNCFFRCISKVISGSEKYHAQIRNFVVKFQDMNKKKFGEHFDVRLHLMESCMDRSGVWATECELFAAATMLQTTINVYTKCGYGDRVWVPYQPCFKLKTTTKLEGQIYLSNYFNVHFNVVSDTWALGT
ncbi:hypothetical protein ScPMuIL_013019 [Solemya velum]